MVIYQNRPTLAPVTLGDSSGNPKPSVGYNQITVYLQKPGAVPVQKTIGSSDWIEVSPAGMPGVYDLQLSPGDTSQLGFLKYTVTVTGSPGFNGILEVQAPPEDTAAGASGQTSAAASGSGLTSIGDTSRGGRSPATPAEKTAQAADRARLAGGH